MSASETLWWVIDDKTPVHVAVAAEVADWRKGRASAYCH